MSYRIRKARMDETTTVAAIARAATTIFPVGAFPACADDDVIPDTILEDACTQHRLWFVAQAATDTPVGFGLLRVIDGCMLLVELAVHPEHGQQGLGSTLVEALAAHTQKQGHSALYLTTFAHLPWNAPFYTRLGFTPLHEEGTPLFLCAILQDEYNRGFTNRVAMRLDLTTPHGCKGS